ncbi:hypothetical protein B0H10DRAFT_2308685 [Mycena sp. CBHHK59/15]|nr:hypothetical protein B0H10DRAFT_2308685 [Mycena sp. CBHHK59/15]
MTLREISDRSLRRDLRAGMKHRDADLRDTRYDTQPDARACHGAGRPDGVGHYGHPGKYEPRVMITAANPCAPRIPMRRDSAIHIEWYLDHDAKHPIAARKGGGRRERRGVYMGGERGGREKVPVGGHGGEKGEGRHRMERKEWAVGVGVRARRSIRGELTGMWECSGNVRGRKWVEVERAYGTKNEGEGIYIGNVIEIRELDGIPGASRKSSYMVMVPGMSGESVFSVLQTPRSLSARAKFREKGQSGTRQSVNGVTALPAQFSVKLLGTLWSIRKILRPAAS